MSELTMLWMAEALEQALLARLERMTALPRKMLPDRELRYLGSVLTAHLHYDCPWARQHVCVRATQKLDTMVEFSLHPLTTTGTCWIDELRKMRGEEWDELSGLPYCAACGTQDTRALAAGKDGRCEACSNRDG